MSKFIAVLIIFGLGYALGRRAGIGQGRQLGFAQAVIDLRIAALEQGVCPLCHDGYHAAGRSRGE